MLAVRVYGCASRPDLGTLATQIAHALTPMDNKTRQALADGLADALGFLGGGLAGWQLGRLLGVDITTASGFSAHILLGWALLLAGLGAGKWASLRWRARHAKTKP